MNNSISRILLAGVVGGIVLILTAFLLFFIIGGLGSDPGRILLDPSIQSNKLIVVWTEIEQLPLIITNPFLMFAGYILFAIGHAFIYDWLSPTWPHNIKARSTRLAILVFFLSYSFLEFFTPFHLFGEPVPLLVLELVFWAIVALAEAFIISVIFEMKSKTN